MEGSLEDSCFKELVIQKAKGLVRSNAFVISALMIFRYDAMHGEREAIQATARDTRNLQLLFLKK